MLVNKTSLSILGISLFHACFLLLVTFIFNDQPYMHFDESSLMRWASVLKKNILHIDDKPPRENFLFINIGYDVETALLQNEYGFPVGKQIITDRNVLTKFFKIVNNHSTYKYFFCGLYFDLPSDSLKDARLQAELSKAKNLVIARNWQPDAENEKNLFSNIPAGLINYDAIGGNEFLKFRVMFKDSLKTVPLLMHEKNSGRVFTSKGSFYQDTQTHDLFLNNFILDFRIRPYDLLESEERYTLVNLGEELLQLDEQAISQLIKDRIIIIGDFIGRDDHDTIMGQMPGSLIITNAFLALVEQDNKITFALVAFLLGGYFIISMFIFTPSDLLMQVLEKMFPKLNVVQWVFSYLTYVMYLTLLAFLTYLIFNIQISILLISIYVKMLDWVIEKRFHEKILSVFKYSYQ